MLREFLTSTYTGIEEHRKRKYNFGPGSGFPRKNPRVTSNEGLTVLLAVPTANHRYRSACSCHGERVVNARSREEVWPDGIELDEIKSHLTDSRNMPFLLNFDAARRTRAHLIGTSEDTVVRDDPISAALLH